MAKAKPSVKKPQNRRPDVETAQARANQEPAAKPVSLRPLKFEEAVAGLAAVKPDRAAGR